MTNDKATKPWHGRFQTETDADFEQFSASIDFDCKLYRQDIAVSIAHAKTLAQAGLLSKDEVQRIVAGLEQICKEIEQGNFQWSQALEDIHMNIEARLIALVGPVGKKLHTGRSRNDLVASSLRLYLREAVDALQTALKHLQTSIVDKAEGETQTLMPGYTHLQAAQPVSFAYHLMAWFEMLKRDGARLRDLRKRIDVLPLGSAALAGTSHVLDRQFAAKVLGFEQISDNAMDAVSDRDFCIEFCACAAMLMMHLSRMAEELVLWSSQPFGFVEFSDAYATGSSIMPQKKNPDAAELIRGKSARSFGNLIALLSLMKSQPLAYNRDNQEDKEALFDSIETVGGCVPILTAVIKTLKLNRQRMAKTTQEGYTTATDLADYLVVKGVPFRDAHAIVGQFVQTAIAKQCRLCELDLQWMQSKCAEIAEDVFLVLDEKSAMAARNSHGGTSPQQVSLHIRKARAYLVSA